MNEVSPVTETEMRDFWSRLSTMIVNASVQARQLAEVQSAVNDLNSRLTSLSDENAKLKSEVAETWQVVARIEQERDSAKAEVSQVRSDLEQSNQRHQQVVQDYESRLAQAHDAMVSRDQRIAELEQRLVTSQRESADWQTKANQAEAATEQVKSGRDYWQRRAEAAEAETNKATFELGREHQARQEAEITLGQVQTKLAELRSLFEPPQPAIAVVA